MEEKQENEVLIEEIKNLKNKVSIISKELENTIEIVKDNRKIIDFLIRQVGGLNENIKPNQKD